MKGFASTGSPTVARCLVFAAAMLTAAVAMADPPPVGRTYFVATVGLAGDISEPYDLSVGCLEFTESEICVVGGDCGTWQTESWGDPGPRQGAGRFMIQITDDETGLAIDIAGEARIDARGKKSTIAGAAHAIEPMIGLELNFGFVGRHVPQARCLRLVEQYEELLAANP